MMEASNVNVSEIHRGVAVDDPVGQHAACAGGGDAPAEDYACFKCVAKRRAEPLDALQRL